MKKVTILAVAMLALSASLAMADGVNLYINDCSAGGTENSATNACTVNTGTAFVAWGSVILPTATKNLFVGAMSIVDVQTNSAGAIEDWWRADACRGLAAFGLVTDATMGGSCATLWDTAAPAGNNVSAVYGAQGAPANRIRFLLGAVLLPNDVYDLTGDNTTELSVFKFTVLRSKSVGTGSCVGCSAGACMVLNEIQLQGQNDHSMDDYMRVVNAAGNNHISYNPSAGLPLCPDAVPVHNRTWGSVKALYR